MLLSKKSAVVTGAGQGIGLALAQALAAEGASVVVNDINAAAADAATRALLAEGRTAVADHHDIATFAGAESLVTACVAAFGTIDILVNNAGVLRDRMSFNMSEAEWDLVVDVCLKGTFACSKFAAQHMRKAGYGRIINVSSRSGLRGSVGQANYAAAKAGVLGLTRTMCQELAKSGITVNAISPRAVTEMTDSVPAEVWAKKDASWAGSSVVRRGRPDQIGPLVVYLASDEAADVTGQVVGIGGDKLSLWSHPKEVAEAFVFGGWDVARMRDLFRSSVGFELQTLANRD